MIDYILSGDGTFNNLSLLIDNDGIIPQTASIEKNSRTILFAETPIELRLLFDAHIRDIDDGSSSGSFLIVYHGANRDLPYDIEKKCMHLSVTLASLYPALDENMIRDLSPNSYSVLFEKTHHMNLDSLSPLSGEKTAAFVLQALYGSDITSFHEKEQLIRFLIDLHLSDEALSPPLLAHILSSMGDRFFPGEDMHKLLVDKAHFFSWLGSRFETFLHGLPIHDFSSAEHINFSHPDLSMTIYRLIANAKMPHPELPEQLTRIELEPEDQWILLLYPHGHPNPQGKNSTSAQEDPEIIAQLEKIRSIAQVDQESFLMKTRKTMESIVNDLLTSEDRAAASYTLFEKLKYLEDRSRLPKTTATFFHTIRKLGNLGAHEAREIRLSPSEIETILSMLSYVLHWYKGNRGSIQ